MNPELEEAVQTTIIEDLEESIICPLSGNHKWVLRIEEGIPFLQLHPDERNSDCCIPIEDEDNQSCGFLCEETMLPDLIQSGDIPVAVEWIYTCESPGGWHGDTLCNHAPLFIVSPLAVATQEDVDLMRTHIHRLEEELLSKL